MKIDVNEKLYEIIQETVKEKLEGIEDEVKQSLGEMLSEKVISELSLNIFDFGKDEKDEEFRRKKVLVIDVNFVDFDISRGELSTNDSLSLHEYISGMVRDFSEKTNMDITKAAGHTVWELDRVASIVADNFGIDYKDLKNYRFIE